jgi:hypothetical protein
MTDAENSVPATVGRPWQRGQSGNPGGRPPGLARLAREATADGVDVVGFFVLVSRGEKPTGWPDTEKLTAEHMIRANEWLADRGFGKAPLQIEMNDNQGEAEEALQGMSIHELRAGIAFMRMQEDSVASKSHALPEVTE